ncbi:hypothetical protein BFJ70_g4818 [Fusarium oxysporum]|nr:hypothetical protein H9L39_14045 [Fusarium oxysporum f. sp. albedinis]RKL03212.1 hypothetical protein BFJ71_g4307 [Fusarium oxysporum]RKL42075.1 hypothetical protein BFJ70_g4818 [Fusarium oxysporum]
MDNTATGSHLQHHYGYSADVTHAIKSTSILRAIADCAPRTFQSPTFYSPILAPSLTHFPKRSHSIVPCYNCGTNFLTGKLLVLHIY